MRTAGSVNNEDGASHRLTGLYRKADGLKIQFEESWVYFMSTRISRNNTAKTIFSSVRSFEDYSYFLLNSYKKLPVSITLDLKFSNFDSV